MKSKIFFVSSYVSVGCTFLEWSIHWLAGRTHYQNYTKGTLPLVDNPVTHINAHLHDKNHPSGFDNTVEAISLLRNSTDFGSVYPATSRTIDVFKQLSIDKTQFTESDMTKVKTVQLGEYTKIWNYCTKNDIPKIFVALDQSPLYLSACKRFFKNSIVGNSYYQSEEEFHNATLNIFYKGDVELYEQFHNWDKRELMALNMRPFQSDDRMLELDFSCDHKFINASQLWTFGEDVAIECLEYLDIPLDTSRIDQWRIAYRDWQQIQKKILKFVYDIDHIVESIVNNYDFDLRAHKLTLVQESIIQHLLIYKHNVTIKNWQLEKFPNNTKDLHQLLEPNFHLVERLYQ